MLVVTALVVTLAARSTAPDATAATTDQTFETAGHVITQAPDGTVTILDKRTQTAVQGTADTTSPALTEQELAAKADGLSQQFKKNLGWDLESEADRTRLITETRNFSQQLHNIPQATLDLEENAVLRELRDIVDEMDGTKNCRERCLITETVKTVIVGLFMGASLRTLKNYITQGKPLYAHEAVAGIIFITALFAHFLVLLARDLTDMPASVRAIVRAIMTGVVLTIFDTFVDTAVYVAQWRATMRQEVTDAARHLGTLTPDDEPATDYDLAKDEL
jgi:hypothetical protein